MQHKQWVQSRGRKYLKSRADVGLAPIARSERTCILQINLIRFEFGIYFCAVLYFVIY